MIRLPILLIFLVIGGNAVAQNPYTTSPKPTLNVKDFGAKGDGVSDDYQALRAAAAAINQNRGGTLVFPPGTYYINRYRTGTNGVMNIEFTDCDRLFIDGYGATIEVKGDFYRPLDLPPADSSYNSVIPLYFRNCTNFSVRGIKIDGNVELMTRDPEVSEGPSHGLQTNRCYNYTIEDVTARRFAGDGIYLGDSETNSDRYALVQRVQCVENARDGISIIALRDAIIRDSSFEYNGWQQGQYLPHSPASGLNVEAPKTAVLDYMTGNITTTNCVISNNKRSQLQGAGLNKENITFRGCTIEQGISTYENTVNLAVINGLIEDCKMDVRQIVPSWQKYVGTSTTIRNCEIRTDYRGITDYINPGSRTVIIEGNTIIGTHTSPATEQIPLIRNPGTIFRNNTIIIPKAAKNPELFAHPISYFYGIQSSSGNIFRTDFVSSDGSHFYADYTATTNITNDQYPSSPYYRMDRVSHLVYTASPGTSRPGVPFFVQPELTVRNTSGNIGASYRGSVKLVIKENTGTTGAVLFGPVTVPVQKGVANFADIGIDRVGSGYVLATVTENLPVANSSPFLVTDQVSGPTQLAFLTQPGDAGMYVPFGKQPVVGILDAYGSVVQSYNGSVTVSLKSGTGTSGATLSGTRTINAVNGIATFSNLMLDRSGTGFVLTAASGSLPLKDSAAFSVAQTAYSLKFTTQPSGATAGSPFTTQPRMVIRDRNGYTATNFTGPVTLSIRPGTGTSGAVLSGTTTVNAVGGIATFTNLSINLAGTGYILNSSSPGLVAYPSQSFSVASSGGSEPPPSSTDASHLKFLVQPAGAVAGKAFTTQPQIVVRNLSGYTVTAFNGPITMTIKAGTGASGARLLGTTTVNAVRGVATFTNLAIDKAGTGYILKPVSGTLIGYDSKAFAVSP